MPSYPKHPTYRSEAWRRAVASLPCVLCKTEGRTQAAHVNAGKGMGIKTHDCWTAALCVECHTACDSGKDMSKEDRRRTLELAVLLTLAELAVHGLVSPNVGIEPPKVGSNDGLCPLV